MNDAGGAWSSSTFSVRETLRERLGNEAAVATVVGVEGSAYRRPGAKRVLTKDEAVGAITAGCLEGPVADLAEQALADGALCETFDLTGEDEAWGFGLGCNGIIDVLVEPADESFRLALEYVEDGHRVALLTVVGGEYSDSNLDSDLNSALNSDPDPDPDPDSGSDLDTGGDSPVPVGARTLLTESGETESRSESETETADPRPPIPDDLLAAVRETATEFARSGRSDTVEVETERGTADVFVDGLEPVPDLLVFGHGEDVNPVARLARDAGFRVTVATARGARADDEQFPAAHEVVATRPPEVADAVSRPGDTYAVLMSHNFVDDRLALEALLDTEVPYIGLMGPRKRFEQMREAMSDSGVELSTEDRERISTPIGLDLGGGEPTQIALSIVSEVLAVSNDCDGGRLTDSEGPIHPRSAVDAESS